VKVGGAITSLEDSKEGRVLGGVRFGDIHHLHVQLEASSALITSDLYPDIRGRYRAVMPC
jgi:hypothetical protein